MAVACTGRACAAALPGCRRRARRGAPRASAGAAPAALLRAVGEKRPGVRAPEAAAALLGALRREEGSSSPSPSARAAAVARLVGAGEAEADASARARSLAAAVFLLSRGSDWEAARAVCEEGYTALGLEPGAFAFALAAAGAYGGGAGAREVDALLAAAEAEAKGEARRARRGRGKGGGRRAMPPRKAKVASPGQPRGVAERPTLLLQDEHLAVLSKPANMLTHPVAGGGGGDKRTLADCALSLLGEGQTSALYGPTARGVAHRLDRGTSGCIAVARHSLAHARLAYAFYEPGVICKEYSALVQLLQGLPGAASLEGELASPVKGLPARTRYELATSARSTEAGIGLLRAWPLTGRRHQIRIHAAEGLGAVIGDEIHGPGPSSLPPAVREVLAPHKQGAVHMLHARRLRLPHPMAPRDDEILSADYDSNAAQGFIEVEAPYPKHFEAIAKHAGLTLVWACAFWGVLTEPAHAVAVELVEGAQVDAFLLALATTLGGLFIAGTKLTTADEDLFLSKGLASVPALLQKRLERMSYKEAKLDVTVLVNYCLARWWVKFAVHGPQLSVGFTASKLMDLVQLTASLSGLSIAWVAYGVLTGQFERDERTREQSLQKWVATSATTAAAAALSWQLLEQLLYSQARLELLEHPSINWATALGDGALMACVMLAYRVASYYTTD